MCTPVTVKVRYTVGTETPGPSFTVPWPITSDYSTVEVLVDPDGASGFTQKVEGTHYTFDEDTLMVTFLSPYIPDDGAWVIIQRCTLRPRQTEIQNDGVVIGRVLNGDEDQAYSIIQEVESGLYDAMRKEPGGRWWDAEGIEVQNGSPATLGTSLVTLSQVTNMLQGHDTAIIDNSTILTYVGDNVETQFELTGFKNLTRGMCEILVNSVQQSARPSPAIYNILNPTDDDYPGGGSGFSYVEFTTAPPDGADIEIKVISGSVATTLADGSVGTEQLEDGSVTLAKLTAGAGAAGRVFFADAAGDVTAAVPAAADISDFDAAVLAHTLDEFSADADVDLGGNELLNIAAGTLSGSATNYAQVLAMILEKVQSKQDSCQSEIVDMTAVDDIATDIEIGFIPDVFVLCAQFHSTVDRDITFVCYFGSGVSNERRLTAATYDAFEPMVIHFQRVGTGTTRIRMTLKDTGGVTIDWTKARYLALKFG